MRVFRDYEGRHVFLLEFDERHIVARHWDLAALGLYDVIGEVLASPDIVIYPCKSISPLSHAAQRTLCR